MIWTTLLLLGATLSREAPAVAPVSEDKVREAIEFGRTAPDSALQQYVLKTTERWVANFDTPFLRVAQLAALQRKADKRLSPSDVPASFVTNEVDVYVHARFQADTKQFLNVEYVTVLRPIPNGRSESILPRDVDRFVRQVPADADYYGPARIAKSVRARFQPDALKVGGQVRIVFEGGIVETVVIEANTLDSVR